MFAKQTRVRIRKFHHWVGAIVGLQLVIWVVTGVYFAWVSIKDIRGDSNKADSVPSEFLIGEIVSLKDIEALKGIPIKSVRLDFTPRGLLYRIESTKDPIKSYDAMTGVLLPPLKPDEVRSISLSQVKQQSEILDVTLLGVHSEDYKGQLPAYRIQLDDFLETRLFVDPISGKLIVQRNMLWRLYDFFWMLHIMDYSTREDFNNPWIKTASLASFTILLSGYLLFWFGRRGRRKEA